MRESGASYGWPVTQGAPDKGGSTGLSSERHGAIAIIYDDGTVKRAEMMLVVEGGHE